VKLNKTLTFMVLLLLWGGLRSSAQQQQKAESKVDVLLRKYSGSHEEHDRACHDAIQAAVAKKQKINPSSHQYANDIKQLQPLRHEVEDTCALFEYVSIEDQHELISFMAVAQSRDPRPPKCPPGYRCIPSKDIRTNNPATRKVGAAQ
jgi:hypothetical protein